MYKNEENKCSKRIKNNNENTFPRPTAEHSSQTFSLDGCKNVSLVFQVFKTICQQRMKETKALEIYAGTGQKEKWSKFISEEVLIINEEWIIISSQQNLSRKAHDLLKCFTRIDSFPTLVACAPRQDVAGVRKKQTTAIWNDALGWIRNHTFLNQVCIHGLCLQSFSGVLAPSRCLNLNPNIIKSWWSI